MDKKYIVDFQKKNAMMNKVSQCCYSVWTFSMVFDLLNVNQVIIYLDH